MANRVSQIPDLSSIENWFFVPSISNPADVVSRGLMPQELADSDIWWNGPLFLREDMYPESYGFENNFQETEYKKNETKVMTSQQSTFDLIHKYSNYNKILKISSLCIRFVENIKASIKLRRDSVSSNSNKSKIISTDMKNFKPINAEELENALLSIIKHIQQQEYSDEIYKLSKSMSISKKSKLTFLNPFIDEKGIVRVGGRLKHSSVDYNQKHPMVLPSSHFFTQLLVKHYHIIYLHAGPQALLCNLRLRFWIIWT